MTTAVTHSVARMKAKARIELATSQPKSFQVWGSAVMARSRASTPVSVGARYTARTGEPRSQPADDARHFGLVVDDVPAARAAVTREGLAIVGQSRRSFDFLDPWGNRFQVVGYGDVQFDRVEGVKRKLGIEQLGKTDEARRQISERGID